jgi:hypothetical protein
MDMSFILERKRDGVAGSYMLSEHEYENAQEISGA